MMLLKKLGICFVVVYSGTVVFIFIPKSCTFFRPYLNNEDQEMVIEEPQSVIDSNASIDDILKAQCEP